MKNSGNPAWLARVRSPSVDNDTIIVMQAASTLPRLRAAAAIATVCAISSIPVASGAAGAGWRFDPWHATQVGSAPLIDRLSFTGAYRFTAADERHAGQYSVPGLPVTRAPDAPGATSVERKAVRAHVEPAVAVVGAASTGEGRTRAVVIEAPPNVDPSPGEASTRSAPAAAAAASPHPSAIEPAPFAEPTGVLPTPAAGPHEPTIRQQIAAAPATPSEVPPEATAPSLEPPEPAAPAPISPVRTSATTATSPVSPASAGNDSADGSPGSPTAISPDASHVSSAANATEPSAKDAAPADIAVATRADRPEQSRDSTLKEKAGEPAQARPKPEPALVTAALPPVQERTGEANAVARPVTVLEAKATAATVPPKVAVSPPPSSSIAPPAAASLAAADDDDETDDEPAAKRSRKATPVRRKRVLARIAVRQPKAVQRKQAGEGAGSSAPRWARSALFAD